MPIAGKPSSNGGPITDRTFLNSAPAGAIIGSNTSQLSITAIGAGSGRDFNLADADEPEAEVEGAAEHAMPHPVQARVQRVVDGQPVLADGTVLYPDTVVWCTGFRNDFSWIDFPVADITTSK